MPVRLVPVPWDCQPLEAGVISESFRRGLLLVADAGAPVPQFMSIGLNRQIRGFVRGGGKSGYGYGVTAASEYPRGRAQDDGTDQALLEISASSDWTMQFVVESIGSAGTNSGFFRCSAAGTGGTWFLQDGSTRRPWVRVNSTDILRPGSGAQWTTGQKLNAIVRFRNASQIEVWWDGRLQHSASHSTSQDALTVASNNAIYAFAVQGQGGGGAETTTGNWLGYRAWARYLDDQEMHALARDELALYEPRRIWCFVSAGATPRSATASLSAAIQASRTATASIAAAVQEQRSAAASAAAAVQQARTTSASVAAAVRQDHTASASIAAAILQARTAAADIAAAVQQGRTASASIAAAVQAARSATASGSAAVQAGASVSASLSAQVQAGSTVAASLDVAVQAARSATAALAGAVQTPRTAQSSIAAAVAAGSSVAASLAAAVREARSAGASISAQVQAGTTIVAQITAAILESKAASAAIAAAVAQQRTVSATLAAAVRSGRVASAAVSAYISAPGDHTVSPRLYLVDPQDRAYLIDTEDRTYIVPASSRSTTA